MNPSLDDSLGAAWSTADVSTPRASTSSASTHAAAPHAFFGRTRSHSLRPSQLAPSLDGSAAAGPSTPTSSAGSDYLSSSVQSATSTAPSSTSSSTSSSRIEPPFVKSVTVPHYSGASGKHCMFACRVVPDLDVASASFSSSSNGTAPSRREHLGKMRMAGTGEPHTVWRSWQECLDFSAWCVSRSLIFCSVHLTVRPADSPPSTA